MRKIILLGVILSMVLSGCETFKGMGRDIENTATNIGDLFD